MKLNHALFIAVLIVGSFLTGAVDSKQPSHSQIVFFVS